MTNINITVEELMGCIAMEMRAEIIHRLMSGNDTQVFSTQQYRDRYSVTSSLRLLGRIKFIDMACARMHLETFPGVTEVTPDVWTWHGIQNAPEASPGRSDDKAE